MSDSSPVGSESSDEDVPNSQNWRVREAAVPADLANKKNMRVTCIRCMKGKWVRSHITCQAWGTIVCENDAHIIVLCTRSPFFCTRWV